jgi:hypothetical protein
MWNETTKVIPAITGATVTVPESFRKYLNNIRAKHEIKELRKAAILAHMLSPPTRTQYKFTMILRKYCGNTAENTDLKIQNVYHGK